MQALREVTEWKVDYRQPNHIYLMDGDKAVAYIKWGESEPEYFKNPIRIDKRYRKFEPADIGLFKQRPASTLVEVAGSKGKVYLIDPIQNTCTCPGFTFRGTCKHTKEYTC
jgi:hypothetical protein